MSGHSKWHSIRHKKGALDAKRGKIFTRLAKAITVSARLGGGDVAMNPSLKLAVDKAKAANMPNANIDRAIKSGTGELKDGVEIHEVMYEGYGPSGSAFYVRALTDNKNRTLHSVRTCFNKNAGNLGDSGTVAFQFERKGSITFIAPEGKSFEEIELLVMEADCDDVNTGEEDQFIAICDPNQVASARDYLEGEGAQIKDVSIVFVPKVTLELADDSDAKNAMNLVNALEDDDDVDEVFTNFTIPDEVLDRII